MSDPEKNASTMPTKEPGEPISEKKEAGEPETTPSTEKAAPEKKKREYKDFGHDEVKATRE